VIQLTCANCRNTLEVDDAFAGGVCRCQYCGTIQTVPKPGSRPSAPGAASRQAVGAAASNGAGDEPRALYQVKSRSGASSVPSGLEELAEVVHSSGLGSGLHNRAGTRGLGAETPGSRRDANRSMWIAVGIGAGVVIVIGLILAYVMTSSSSTPATDAGAETASVPAEAQVPSSPAFLSIELSADKVVYVVDRGDATATFFPAIKRMVAASVASLGGDRKFSVILWNNGDDDSYPRSGTAYASADEVAKLKSWFDNVPTGRSTSVDSAIASAVSQQAGEVVLMTAKADQLEGTEFAADVLAAVKGKSIPVHAVTLGDSPAADPLKRVAAESKGKFLHVNRQKLFELNDQ
jgi:hypothetical protein